MYYKKNFLYVSLLCFAFFFLAISYEHSDTTLKRMEQEVLASNQLGVYKNDIAENFQLLNMKGEKVALSDFKGKKVVVNFFATWCGPCQEEMPILVSLDKKVSDDKLIILGVNMTKEERNANQVREFIKHFKVEYEVVYDGDGKVMKEYQLIGIPTTLFIDEKGKIVDRINGLITEDIIKDHIFFKGIL